MEVYGTELAVLAETLSYANRFQSELHWERARSEDVLVARADICLVKKLQ